MLEMPRERVPDSTLALMRDPYGYISRHCRRHRSDLFETRFLIRKAICMTGPEAAAYFYDRDRFARAGSAPSRIQKTLFGQGGVQGLDGPEHRHRKQMFRSLTTAEEIGRLSDAVIGRWSDEAARWASNGPVVLYDRQCEVLTRATCRWSGVPLAESEVDRRT